MRAVAAEARSAPLPRQRLTVSPAENRGCGDHATDRSDPMKAQGAAARAWETEQHGGVRDLRCPTRRRGDRGHASRSTLGAPRLPGCVRPPPPRWTPASERGLTLNTLLVRLWTHRGNKAGGQRLADADPLGRYPRADETAGTPQPSNKGSLADPRQGSQPAVHRHPKGAANGPKLERLAA